MVARLPKGLNEMTDIALPFEHHQQTALTAAHNQEAADTCTNVHTFDFGDNVHPRHHLKQTGKHLHPNVLKKHLMQNGSTKGLADQSFRQDL